MEKIDRCPSGNEKKLKEYIPPEVDVTMVEMEQGIANGSARVIVGGMVTHEWEDGEKIEKEVEW
ncbi:hypothetical protein [Elizabethkingia meningoseptica]|uniref:hypothetical protein n=1 Tax=Elizabethkingia meningoseptica TaxID=238 RepID=UPI00389243D0